MKSKGFTLVELLGVITIIAVLYTIIKHQRDKLYDTQIGTIRDGLKKWGDANVSVYLKCEKTPRLIKANEIAKITGHTTFDSTETAFYLGIPEKGMEINRFEWYNLI